MQLWTPAIPTNSKGQVTVALVGLARIWKIDVLFPLSALVVCGVPCLQVSSRPFFHIPSSVVHFSLTALWYFFSSSKPQQHNCKITQFHHASFAFCHPSLLNPVLISWNLSSFFNFYIHFSPFSHRDGCTTQQAKWNPQCLLGSRTKHLPYCLGSGGRKRCKTPCRVTIQILSLLRA